MVCYPICLQTVLKTITKTICKHIQQPIPKKTYIYLRQSLDRNLSLLSIVFLSNKLSSLVYSSCYILSCDWLEFLSTDQLLQYNKLTKSLISSCPVQSCPVLYSPILVLLFCSLHIRYILLLYPVKR